MQGVGYLKIGIRFAKIEDAQRIFTINEHSLGYYFTVENTKRQLALLLQSSFDKILVAEADGKVIGYIHASDYECTYCDPLKDVKALAVDQQYRGYGTGRKLLLAIENWAMICGCAGVRLISGTDREGAHQFYLHCGYTLRKQHKNFVKYFHNTPQ